MSEYEKEAETLLACTARCSVAGYPYSEAVSHSMDCPHLYRQKVAARLAERDSIIESIYEALDGLPMTGEKTSPKSREYLDAVGQIKALKAQLATAEQRCKKLEANCKAKCEHILQIVEDEVGPNWIQIIEHRIATEQAKGKLS